MGNQQLHQRIGSEQIKTILRSYCLGEITSLAARNKLEIGKTRFFELIKEFKKKKDAFKIEYRRHTPNNRIKPNLEKQIITELKAEKKLIENKNIPIKHYNYSAILETVLEKCDGSVSLTMVIRKAKIHGFYITKKLRKVHDQMVITNFIGELIQHDSSFHLWSPYMDKKLYLITSLDDYSRMILYADFVEKETAWSHILALESVILQYGCPLKYYCDQHSVFRYVRNRDKNSFWVNLSKFTDDIDPQFKQVLKECNIGITYALSPQAKGKVERSYGWIQDRIVRIAAKERLTTIKQLRKVLKELVYKYNTIWVHSTTKEIPAIRFQEALDNQQCLFKPLKIIKPNRDVKDIFCLRIKRMINAYRKVSFGGLEITVPKGNPRDIVEIKIIPDTENNLVELRFWQENNFLGNQKVKLTDLKIVRF